MYYVECLFNVDNIFSVTGDIHLIGFCKPTFKLIGKSYGESCHRKQFTKPQCMVSGLPLSVGGAGRTTNQGVIKLI